MIVVDASAVVEVLIGSAPPPDLFEVLQGDLYFPHLLDVEVLSAIGGLVLGRIVNEEFAAEALKKFWSLGATRYGTVVLSGRIWELRYQFTSYVA